MVVYRWSKGRFGAEMQDLPVLILHTVGRTAGKPRPSPLLCIQDGENLAITGSWGESAAPHASSQ